MTTTDSGRPGRRALPRLRRAFVPLLLLLLLLAAPAAALDTIWLVRHAEKVEDTDTNKWPFQDALRPLTPEGNRRAEALAIRLKDAGIAAVYTSRTTRTLSTALPLVLSAPGIRLIPDDDTIAKDKQADFLAWLRKTHAGDRAILIVGHSNTIPVLLEKLGAKPDCYERLGLKQTPQGLMIEGYEGLWKMDTKKSGCEGITRE